MAWPWERFEAIAHRPLLIHMPGDPCAGQRIDALTTTVDFYPTILEGFEVEPPGPCHGRSMVPLMDGRAESIRDSALYGWFGAHMQVTDGRCTYMRAARTPSNEPLYIYTNRWSTAPRSRDGHARSAATPSAVPCPETSHPP